MTPISQYNVLLSFLKEQVDNDYVYLDVPAYLNVGDMLIAMGAFELLKQIPHRCLLRATWFNEDITLLPENCVILMQGGGNFGDLYQGANWYRMQIARRFPNNKIIILPVTVTYKDINNIEEVKEFEKHKNLHICARDSQSYDFLQEYFAHNTIHLLPDCAFGLSKILPQKNKDTGKSLYIKRKDFELLGERDDWSNVENKDWDDILKEINFSKVLLGYRVLRKLQKLLPCHITKRLNDWYLLTIEYPFLRKKIPNYFLQYDIVYTTRMHGFILSSMLYLPTQWEDTKYGKTSNYVNTWMKDE